MAFNCENLNMVSSGKNVNAATIWSYKSSDETISTISASGYFNDAWIKFKVNDLIWVIASDASRHYRITSNTIPVTVAHLDFIPGWSVGTAGSYYDVSTGFDAFGCYVKAIGIGIQLTGYNINVTCASNSTTTELYGNKSRVFMSSGSKIKSAKSYEGILEMTFNSTIINEASVYTSRIYFPAGLPVPNLPTKKICNFYADYVNNSGILSLEAKNKEYNAPFVSDSSGINPPQASYLAVQSYYTGIVPAAFKAVNATSFGGTGFQYGLDLATSDSKSATITTADIRMAAGNVIFTGNGAPTHYRPKGSIYIRLDGSSFNTRIYIATDAVGNWTPIICDA